LELQALNYTPALDGYRFLAAMIVVLGHFSNETGIWGQILGKGAEEIGVIMFFCLSGFLMGALYFPRPVTSTGLLGFMMRRLGRVLPLFYVINGIGLCLAFFGVTEIFFEIDIISLVRAIALIDGQHVMWTIVAECYFYFIFALIWLTFSRSKRLAIFLLVVGMLLGYYLQARGADLQRENVFQYLHIFGAGVLLSVLMHDIRVAGKLNQLLQRPLLANGAFILVGLLILLSYPVVSLRLGIPLIGRYESLTMVVLCCAFLWLSMKTSVGEAVLGNPLALFGGKISYSIYLWHMPVIWSLLPVLSSVPREGQLLIMVISVIAISWVSFKIIEKPGQRMFRTLDQYLERILSKQSGDRSSEA